MGEELDARSDVYSLGIVLYEMLTGSVPFKSPTSTAVVVQHVNQPPTPLRSLNLSAKPLVGDGVAMQRISARDKKGADWRGVLLLITAGDTQELTLRMTRAGEK